MKHGRGEPRNTHSQDLCLPAGNHDLNQLNPLLDRQSGSRSYMHRADVFTFTPPKMVCDNLSLLKMPSATCGWRILNWARIRRLPLCYDLRWKGGFVVFGNNTISLHILRGVLAAAAIYGSLATMSRTIWPAIILLPTAVYLMKG